MRTDGSTRRVLAAALGVAALGLAAACGESANEPTGKDSEGQEQASWSWDLPEDVPEPEVPEDNPVSEAKAELGRFLFYDDRLSGNETQACADCHKQEKAFTDGRAQALGSTGEDHPRGAMSLANVAYASSLNWANPSVGKLRNQALTPMFGENPVELGLSDKEQLLERLRRSDDPDYTEMFREAYRREGEKKDSWITLSRVVKALATFQRTIISFQTPFDDFAYRNDRDALTEKQKKGKRLFFSERLECFHCHGGFNFTDSTSHENTSFENPQFHNNGLYNVDGEGSYPEGNQGLYEITGDPDDRGRFKAPTLRNIAVTDPYMHDGSLETLEEVIEHYARGGTKTEEGPEAGDGQKSPLKSELITGFEISEAEKDQLIAFLKALTDEELLTDPKLSNPFQ